jgi:hypothetical protein
MTCLWSIRSLKTLGAISLTNFTASLFQQYRLHFHPPITGEQLGIVITKTSAEENFDDSLPWRSNS